MTTADTLYAVKKTGEIIYFTLRRRTGSTYYVRCHEDFATKIYDEAMDNGWSIAKTTDTIWYDRSRYGRSFDLVTELETNMMITRLNRKEEVK